ncbi:hypothetical protein Ahy_B07g088610 isoform F [Arachis hypogaea]|uniref:Disease resistance N-terminal domain-containing protein n=1 Tax=Arachis hypogaea TaxID=3818 RepID=A0A444YF08_ARAHY|nr:hypothetical protein Ahy_B07g088610 isoform F [Arachis hypogaea]
MIQRFKAILNAAEGPVNDAERRQIREGPVKIWLDDLKDAIYEADDFLDEIATKAATKKDQGMIGVGSWTECFEETDWGNTCKGATLHNNHNCNLKHWCGQFQLVPLSALILPDVTMLY